MTGRAGAGVRVRLEPAPTGSFHVGNARTALFNWLFARHTGGTFVLRIADTDGERSRDEWITVIEDTLRWLGLDWDEGPYRQSERVDRHRAAAAQLLASGAAYRCYCTEEEIRARAAASPAGSTLGYDGRCRELTEDQQGAYTAAGQPFSVRFRTPDEGRSTFADVVRGDVSVEWSTIPDFVILRSSGAPVFFLANAVDDADMGITHVIRGEDLLDSTHRVLALREALGYADRPTFAHLPLLVGADRAKLSKRHGAVAIADFVAGGYLPEALRNYLALLGFSLPALSSRPGSTDDPDSEDSEDSESREVVPVEEIVSAFDLTRVNHSAAFFDYEKLTWMNGEYIRALPPAELCDRIRPFARERYGAVVDEGDVLAGAAAIARVRATTLVGAAEAMGFLFVDDGRFAIEGDSLERLRGTDRAGEILAAVAAHLETCPWTVEGVDLRPVLEALGVKPRKGLPAVYTAVEGTSAGLPLFDSIVLLGRERVLARIRSALILLG